MLLYLLILTDTELSYDNHSEDFYIGFFKTEKEAIETGEYYLHNIKGFRDFPCKYRILSKKVVGILENFEVDKIWLVQGYDINENFDEINIVESQCFITKEQADSELEILKNKYSRTEWTINFWTIGEMEWQEGFCRMADGKSIN